MTVYLSALNKTSEESEVYLFPLTDGWLVHSFYIHYNLNKG